MTREFGSLTAPEIEKLSPEAVLVLPIGSYEQHGPHLPVNTDAVLAAEFARRVTDRWGDRHDLWLLPLLPFGLSREHAWSAGTLSLPVRVFIDLVLAVCEQLRDASPVRNLLIVNGHGGNRGVLEALVLEIRQRLALNPVVTHPSALSTERSGSPLPEVHGGRSETSVMLALAPDLVHLDRLDHSYDPDKISRDAIRRRVMDRGCTWPWTSGEPEIASLGIIGDARQASTDLGNRIVESSIDNHGPVISELLGHRAPP